MRAGIYESRLGDTDTSRTVRTIGFNTFPILESENRDLEDGKVNRNCG